jgi:lipoprotein-anchoring transpeptidase ErfK/SrfK
MYRVMRRITRCVVSVILAVGIPFWLAASPAGAQAPNPAAGRGLPAKLPRGVDRSILKAEVLLDRAGFSPGAIDGRDGDNFNKALTAFQRENVAEATGKLDDATWSRLAAGAPAPVLVQYEIAPDDVKGPFVARIPHRLEDMARLPRLAYAGPREALAEKFHMQEDLLRALNPRADFHRAGTRILVANVMPRPSSATTASASPRAGASGPKVARIEIDKPDRALRAFDADGHLVAFYPASIGSADKPAPSGSFKVKGVARDPAYHYDPKFAFKGVKTRHKLTVKPGPNNPVGSVWIDLTAPSYGIHGTPNPEKIGKTESHGCIRLTNWDALALARMVQKGTQVDFVD